MTRPKPSGLGPEYAAQFRDRSIIDAYRFRPPYPDEMFELLAGLVTGEPGAILDVGCGAGDLARRLAGEAWVDCVDAVDPSSGMIARGRELPGGTHPRLTWITGTAEEAPLRPPYTLITAGSSLHWFDWDVAWPRLDSMLTPDGWLAIVGETDRRKPWTADLGSIITRFSTNRDYAPYNLVEELVARGLFSPAGQRQTAAVPFEQSIDDYVESFHSRNGLSQQRMGSERAAAFDAEVRALLYGWCPSARVELSIVGQVIWGRLGSG